MCDNEENWDKYTLAKMEVKKDVSEAHSTAFEKFYKELGTVLGTKIDQITKIKRVNQGI